MRLNDELGIKFVVPLGTDGLYAGAALVPDIWRFPVVITACQESLPANRDPFAAPTPDILTLFRLGDRFGRHARARLQYVWDCHQIAYNDGRVYYANTGSNSIMIEDYARCDAYMVPHRCEHFFGQSSPKNRRDINHINSLLWHDGFLYAVHHNSNAGQNSGIYKLGADSELNVLDVWGLPSSGVHDLEIANGNFYYCDSQRGALICYDPIGREVVGELVLGGHPKGLEVLGGKLLVGVSAFSRLTEVRGDSPGEIAVVDMNEWKVIARPTIQVAEKNVGNINDILVL